MTFSVTQFGWNRDGAVVRLGQLRIWFSCGNPVAFEYADQPRVVRCNDWGRRTADHLRQIDQATQEALDTRIPGSVFEQQLTAICEGAIQ